MRVGQHRVRTGDCGYHRIQFVSKRGQAFLPAFAVAAFLSVLGHVEGETIRAKSVSFADVSSAVASAHDGDIVLVPAGTASWTSALSITRGIILQGETTIVGSDPSKLTVTDRTVILDDVPRAWNVRGQRNPKAAALIYGNFSKSQRPRITGITFKVGSVTTANSSTAAVYLEGACPNVRIDHCSFYKLNRYNFMTHGCLFGVMDHCWALNDAGSEKFSINHDTYGGSRYKWGDGSWVDGPRFGTDQAFYVEDCAFLSINGKHGSVDGQDGMRRVIRHCYFRGTVAALHGTESGGRHRGSRMVETYQNTFDLRGSGATGSQHRGGTGLYWGNTFLTDATFTRGYELIANRQRGAFRVWGGANGKNPLDSNDTEGNGTYVAGHTPRLYFSGEVSGTADNSCQMAGAGWRPNQWVGFEVTNTKTGKNSLIKANSSDTLTLANQWSGVSHYTAGDKFVIYRLARASMDQPGMGKGDPVTGNPPTNTRWPNQQSEPLYSWLNTRNGSNYPNFFTLPASGFPTIQENRDYFNWNTSFDGTAGVGVGLRSDRPSTCTKGVGYWATDENTLYVARSTNEWSAYYKPYIYPHPLASAGGASQRKTRPLSRPAASP